jgi:hypothetical protein
MKQEEQQAVDGDGVIVWECGLLFFWGVGGGGGGHIV